MIGLLSHPRGPAAPAGLLQVIRTCWQRPFRSRARRLGAALGLLAVAGVLLVGCQQSSTAARPRRAVWVDVALGRASGSDTVTPERLRAPADPGPGLPVRRVAVTLDPATPPPPVAASATEVIVIAPRFGADAELAAEVARLADVLPGWVEATRGASSPARILLVLRGPAFDAESRPADAWTAQLPKLSAAAFAAAVEPVYVFSGEEHAAASVAEVISQPVDREYDLELKLLANGIRRTPKSFYGFRQLGFHLPESGREVTIVRPYRTAPGHPLVWRGEFFGHQPQVDLALLNHGYHVVYVKAQNLYGAPVAMRFWGEALDAFRHMELTGKIVLIGMSRGGLYCYNWAALHPETVAAIYGDAPVCDFKSWPGRRGRSTGPAGLWPELMAAYGFESDSQALAYPNPVDNLAPLAAAGIPIIHVLGTADTAAIPEENSDLVEARYRALGGTIQVIRKPGVDHHPHSLADPTPIVDFILQHARPSR
ncbi:hypothetical protein [Opitutus sp. ER46]|uniref:alpha/beta hydrolase family protein n=1 Tax=Opitutus sp. ER46 TaxID=2161864 RepID=UPI000D3158F9|nr:hypothetical protein [Opitutus sp. ER46]PTX98411.1 hypothetical protein DB354_03840 [Opitutus sp. ER46]